MHGVFAGWGMIQCGLGYRQTARVLGQVSGSFYITFLANGTTWQKRLEEGPEERWGTEAVFLEELW